jgi:hypothetical protein
MKTFKEYLNESVGFEKKELTKHQDLANSIYDLFYQVYDEDDENRRNNPWLNQVYKNLSPIIVEGDDVGLLLSTYLRDKYSEITRELERIEKLLSDAQKKLK